MDICEFYIMLIIFVYIIVLLDGDVLRVDGDESDGIIYNDNRV